MPASSYADVTRGSSQLGREREREAFDHGLSLMEHANASPDEAKRSHDAARYMQQLWGFLIRDLANPGNDLSQELKGNLISIGLWVIRETDAIVAGRKTDWAPIIDINKTVREGLAS